MFVGRKLGGVFEIEKELGSGAMGAVYRATYTKTGQKVAVKIITPGLGASGQAIARFEREVSVLKQLKHPNIVRLLANGLQKNPPFYVMEYIDGESLDRVLARRGRYTWEEVLEFGKQLCAALKHAHDQGIIHRDLKPSNLMLTANGIIKLTDFGIAKDLDVTQLTQANCTVGTAAYMSPEQCKGERNLTHKSDLYSLGILFYELVTGKKPFRAETTMDMFLLHVQGKAERPSRLVLDIPTWFDTLILGLLEKKPEHRPFDAAAVAEQLDLIREKAAAQQSAGIDAAKKRPAEGPQSDAALNETDREAARTLLGGGPKRRKRKQRRFYRKVWFQAACLSGLLAAILGFIVWIFLIPPSADRLYAEAEKLVQSPREEDQARVRSDIGPLKRYLRYYGDRDDPQTKKVREWLDQAESTDREQRLQGLLASKKGKRVINIEPETDEEKLALRAASVQDDGDLDTALKLWQDLERNKNDKDLEKRSWGVLAVRKQQEVKQEQKLLVQCEQQLSQVLDHIRLTGQEPKGINDAEQRALRALRYEQFQDILLARQDWYWVKQKFDKNPGLRSLILLSVKKLKDLRAEPVSEQEEKDGRKKHVQKVLAEATRLADAGKKKEAQVYCRDIVTLYAKDEDLAQEVKEARQLLTKTAPPKGEKEDKSDKGDKGDKS
jgi:serine/threonine-protein kinase